MPNSLLAAQEALRGKWSRHPAASFFLKLEKEQGSLHEELIRGEYLPGAYHYFNIYEPKQQLVNLRNRLVSRPHRLRIPQLFDGLLDSVSLPFRSDFFCLPNRDLETLKR